MQPRLQRKIKGDTGLCSVDVSGVKAAVNGSGRLLFNTEHEHLTAVAPHRSKVIPTNLFSTPFLIIKANISTT